MAALLTSPFPCKARGISSFFMRPSRRDAGDTLVQGLAHPIMWRRKCLHGCLFRREARLGYITGLATYDLMVEAAGLKKHIPEFEPVFVNLPELSGGKLAAAG